MNVIVCCVNQSSTSTRQHSDFLFQKEIFQWTESSHGSQAISPWPQIFNYECSLRFERTILIPQLHIYVYCLCCNSTSQFKYFHLLRYIHKSLNHWRWQNITYSYNVSCNQNELPQTAEGTGLKWKFVQVSAINCQNFVRLSIIHIWWRPSKPQLERGSWGLWWFSLRLLCCLGALKLGSFGFSGINQISNSVVTTAPQCTMEEDWRKNQQCLNTRQ